MYINNIIIKYKKYTFPIGVLMWRLANFDLCNAVSHSLQRLAESDAQ